MATMVELPDNMSAVGQNPSALSQLETYLDLVSDSGALVKDLYDHVGPEQPNNLVKIRVPADELPPSFPNEFEVNRYNYEEGHAGRFTVFGTKGGSVGIEDIMSTSDPPKTLKSHCSTGSVENGETIVFIPGLNTWHEPTKRGERTTPQRMIHYSNVLGGLKMCQMNMGTSADQPNLRVDISSAPKLQSSLKVALDLVQNLPVAPIVNGSVLEWEARQFDTIQTALSEKNIIDTPIKANIRRLLSTRMSDLVVIGYSRGAIEIDAALRQYREEKLKEGRTEAEIKSELRKKLIVVTLGNASRTFVDGPRYIHVSCLYDALTIARGVSSAKPEGAGERAVFLSCDTPFREESFENHNFGTLTSQFLSLLMKLNQITKFADLYSAAGKNTLKMPDNEELSAMIRITRGFRWLFDKEKAADDVEHANLPSDTKADTILARRFDESWRKTISALIASEGSAEDA